MLRLRLTNILKNDRQDLACASKSVDSCDVNLVWHIWEELQVFEDTLPVVFALHLAWIDVCKVPDQIHEQVDSSNT